MPKNIVNIINFIRAVEPREPVDLIEPVRNQLALLQKHGLPGTFLLQYDALQDARFPSLLQAADGGLFEFGVWLEIVEPLTRDAGLPWTGRFPWDWHANCGFSVGYTKPQREKMVDLLFEQFKAVFGTYPKSMGSWAIDAHSLAYASERYGLDASCNCKDQWGTDGYTMWGGYYNQAYYPAKGNMFCPAQTKAEQIDTPIFRMLGSDPIYQYDFGLSVDKAASERQGVVTLEPVYTGVTGGGGEPAWVNWYFKENFNGKSPAFSYTQAGQENSFGWPAMEKGLTDQIEKIAGLAQKGLLTVETLGASGRWFKETFAVTPATAVSAESDWAGRGHKSYWYNCKNYRANLFFEGERFWLRDIYLFREDYHELYHTGVCEKEYLVFDNLPVIDGNRFSGNGVRAGLYPEANGQALTCTSTSYANEGSTVKITVNGTAAGTLTFAFAEEGLSVTADGGAEFFLAACVNESAPNLPACRTEGNTLHLVHRGFAYAVTLTAGALAENGRCAMSENGRLAFCFAGR